jgi:hypothetical protein
MTTVLDGQTATSLRAERARFREFVNTNVMPFADEFDRAQEIPRSLIRSAAEHGFLGAVLSAQPADDGQRMVRLGILHEEVGRGCSSLRSLLTVHSMVVHAVARWASGPAKQRWLADLRTGTALGAFCLTEPEAGSDIARISSTAVTDRDGYLLNGRKKWVTFGQIADVLLVFARSSEGVLALLVDADNPGVRRVPIRGLLGTRASMLAEIRFTDCRVGREALVGSEGMGLALATGALDIGRYSVAAGCVGIAQACLDASVDHTSRRRRGQGTLAELQLVQRLVTDMATHVRAARLLTHQAGQLKDHGDPDSLLASCIAKYFASTTAMRAAQDAVQLHGALGCSDEAPVARYFRDAKVMEIIEGSSEVQQGLIAHGILQGQTDPLSR